MSRLIDVVAKSMELALVDKVILQKRTDNYAIYGSIDKYFIGELEDSNGFCYFNYYKHRMNTLNESEKLLMCTLRVLIKKFLSDNFKLTKLDDDICDHVYYLITEK